MKKHFGTLFLITMFLVGLGLLLYPTVSDYINALHQSKAITSYVESVKSLNAKEYEKIISEAKDYNKSLSNSFQSYTLTDKEKQTYKQLLNVDGNGVMGYLEIPSINLSLPISHGTDEYVLQSGIGHLDWTSLPVGGEGTHCVLSGHRGLPSAKLFTNLDELVIGDTFMITVLNEVLTYEVDQILIVDPNETDALKIVPGKDYCTLLTCTPYGINTQRLLVRGHRIANTQEASTTFITADAAQIEPIIVAPMLAIPALLLLINILLIPKKRRRNTHEENI